MALRLRFVLGGSLALAGLLAGVPGTLRADDATPYPRPLQPPPPAPAPAAQAPQAPRLRTPQELRDLVGPIALYPDVVLSSLLPASAYPLDVVQAARRLRQRPPGDKTPLSDAGWDPSVSALTQFPDVVLWLDENLEWLDQLGAAVAQQPQDVLAAIQRFREDARAAGTLATDEHQCVTSEEMPPPEGAPAGTAPAQVICIRPVEPTVVYVPVYDPAVVLAPAPYYDPGYSVFGWSSGCAFDAYGPWAWHDIGWGWPCGTGWWGCGIYVHRSPCYPERSWRTHGSHRFEGGAAEWHADSRRGAYGPRARAGDVMTPGRPSWSAGAPFSHGTGVGSGLSADGVVRTGERHPAVPTPPTLPRFGGAAGLADAGAATGGGSTFAPRTYAPKTTDPAADARLGTGFGSTDPRTRFGLDGRKERTSGWKGADASATAAPAATPPAVASTQPRWRWFPKSTTTDAATAAPQPRTIPPAFVTPQPRTIPPAFVTPQPRAWQPWTARTLPSATPTPTFERRVWTPPVQTGPAPTSVPAATFPAPTPKSSFFQGRSLPTYTPPAPTPKSTFFADRSGPSFGRTAFGGQDNTPPPPPPPRHRGR